MNQEQVPLFLQALGSSKIRVKGNGWAEATCPLAPWTHAKHSDHTPSFALSVNPGGRSAFNCFGCSRSGSAEELVQAVELYSQGSGHHFDFAMAHKLLSEEMEVMPLPEFQEHPQPVKPFEEWPQYWLDSFKRVSWCEAAITYLQGRNVPEFIWEKFDLRFDSKRQMIVAPYYNVFGKFAGARGRSILPEESGAQKHFDYTWQGHNNAHLVWYNEMVLNHPGPAVIVEGQFDVWRTQQAFLKTLGNLTAKPSGEKMKKLGDCPFIIHIPDPDEAGVQSALSYAQYCKQLGIGYKRIDIPMIGQEKKVDPDRCHVQWLKDRIEELL